MYSLSPRKGLDVLTGTPTNVGPNTYIVTGPKCQYKQQNYAPFLSFTTRETKQKPYTDALYDPPVIRSKIKYGNSLQFTAPRATIQLNEITQGDESGICNLKSCIQKIKKKEIPIPIIERGCRNRLRLCQTPFRFHVNPPSIPARIDVNGYDILENNQLIKILPDEFDNTIGPAYYNVPMDEVCYNTKKYRGCAWSKLRSKRETIQISPNPGPADYDVNYKFCARHEDEEFKALMRKCCNVPRITCQLICKAEKENQPGPGYYEIVNLDKIGKLKSSNVYPRPFINGAKRFQYAESENPGPDHYLPCICFNCQKPFNIKKHPFMFEALRFKEKILRTPGPACYSVETPKCKRYGNVSTSFNSTAPRKWTFLESQDNFPGPADYCNRNIKCHLTSIEHQTSVFQSRVERMVSACEKDQAGPAFYNIADAFNCTRSKKSSLKKNVPFNSFSEKFSKIYDPGLIQNTDNPGVGTYELRKLKKKAGKYFNQSPRFRTHSSEIPGPGYYTLHPSVGESLHKAKETHNSRLIKEVMHKQTKAAERKCTRTPKKEKPKTSAETKKMLRWFAKTTDEYVHC